MSSGDLSAPEKKHYKLASRLVFLRSLTPGDVSEKYLAWLRDPEVNRFLEVRFNPPKDLETLRKFVSSFSVPNRYLFGVFASDQERPIHIGNFTVDINPFHNTAYFGYLIGDKAYWGTPAATEAIVLILDFLFETKKVRRVYGGCYDMNIASVFNFSRFGFVQEGTAREHLLDDGEPVDSLSFGLLKNEWLQKKNEKFGDVPVEILQIETPADL